jgi:hypothetical protein
MTGTRPKDGDVVVHPEQGLHHQQVFVLTPLGAKWETTCPTYAEAVHTAERTARVYKTDIWFTEDGATFKLMSSFRGET